MNMGRGGHSVIRDCYFSRTSGLSLTPPICWSLIPEFNYRLEQSIFIRFSVRNENYYNCNRKESLPLRCSVRQSSPILFTFPRLIEGLQIFFF